jgi:arylsulfatase A-like enzyme
MVVKWPAKVKANTTSHTPVVGTDFFPSFMEFAGIDYSKMNLDGVSLSPILYEKGDLNREAIYWHFPAYLEGYRGMKDAKDLVDNIWRAVPSGAIRMGDWKLIENFETRELQLFNLKNDLSEEHNLAEEKPEIRKKLYNKMLEWRKKTNAPVPRLVNPDYIK